LDPRARQEQAQNGEKIDAAKRAKTTTLSIAYTLADDAISCEPVSGSKFPANRETNREFRRNWPSTALLASDQTADPIAYSRIPCATEQGISERVSGKIFEKQEINIRQGIAFPLMGIADSSWEGERVSPTFVIPDRINDVRS
jgi:hypothetical protein